MKNKKRIFYILLIFAFGFVIADYFEIFPSIYVDKYMFLGFEFTFFDANTGERIEGVEVTGLYKGSDPIYKKYEDIEPGVVDVVARGGGFGYKKTFLFKKPSPRKTIKFVKNKEIEFIFKHPMYENCKKVVSQAKDGDSIEVKLIPLNRIEN